MAADERIVIEAFETEFRKTKQTCEAAVSQIPDEGLHARINPHQNSIAVIIQHLHGNMLSRWTDLLTSDGEKPTRDRESEFVERRLSRQQLMQLWEEGWKCVFAALEPLSDADLPRIVKIRNEPHTLALAIARQLGHYNWHAGQIVLIGKHLLGATWKYLTIPPGGSAAFNRQKGL